MTTTIAPSLGHGVVATQQGVGTSPGYDAVDLRRLMSTDAVQEGVYAAGDFMVTQRGAGANMTVDIAASSGASALVQGDTVTLQGLYFVGPHSATINEAITAADPTNPRVDQVILEVQDNVHDASGGNLARTRVLTGTATAGATLTNRTGAAALPGNALLLADVLVGAAASSITNTVIRDRRKWVRGAQYFYERSNTTDYSTASLTAVVIDGTNMNPRLECSGVPLEVVLSADMQNSTALSATFLLWQDNAERVRRLISATATVTDFTQTIKFKFTPAAGSHTIGVAWFTSAGTISLRASSTQQLNFDVREVVAQSSANNTTTTG